MNWDQIEGRWTEYKGAAKEQWGKLTDDDLSQIEGRREQLSGKIQSHYGKTKDEAEREIDSFLSRMKR